jgi:hypothetical protein
MRSLMQRFHHSISHLAPSTQRLYIAHALEALRLAGIPEATDQTVHNALEAIEAIAQITAGKPLRIAPFFRFLESLANQSGPDLTSYERLAEAILKTLERFIKQPENIKLSKRRDAAIIASAAFAPRRGDPRRWPLSTLKIEKERLLLWSSPVNDEPFKHALRLWLEWRSRLGRPEQEYIFRNQKGWGSSNLLFPGPQGKTLSRTAVHNALKRLGPVGVGEGRPTLSRLQTAFLVYWTTKA